MYAFDSKAKVLRISKVEVSKDAVNRDLMRNQKDSYNLYRTVTIKEDLDYLCALISGYMNGSKIGYILINKPKYAARPNNEIKRKGDEHYPIVVKFTRDGEICTQEITVLKIPFMDDFCVLNVEGKQKVILSEMKALEDISFENKKDMHLTAVLPMRQITLKHGDKGISMKYKKSWMPIDKIITAMMREVGDNRKMTDVFYNSVMRRSFLVREYQTEENSLAVVEKQSMLDMFQSKSYELGRLREMLNQRLTIKDCQGRTLARDIALRREDRVIPAGTVVTEEVLKSLRFNCVNEVLVQERPEIAGMILATDVTIHHLKKGSPLGSFLKTRVLGWQNFSYCPEDREVNIVVTKDTILTDSMLDAFFYCGIDTVRVKPNAGQYAKVIEIPFYREICGNYTIQLKYLGLQNMPAELNGEMYHYYFGQENPWELSEVVSPNYMTAHDMIAMTSLLTRAAADPTIPEVMNRDSDFLKKINRSNEIFSESFRLAADEWVTKSNRKLKEIMLGGDADNVFYGFYCVWKSWLQNRRPLLPPVEDTNPVALLSQVNRVVTLTQSTNSVSDEMRTLALPYYGRICPYETPAGKNIGISNTLAIGCKVENGIPKTPYYRLYGTAENRKIATKVTYLTAIEEQQYRIGDRLSLSFNSNGSVKNTKVIARVKSYGMVDKTIVDTVDAITLDYVNVLPEQHCSSTAMLIPFAAANDGARVSFGLNLIRQSIYVQKSQIPLVMTSMYKELFDYSDSYCTRAIDNGTVIEVSCNAITIKYDGATSETVHQLMETRVSNTSVIAMTFRAYPGQRVTKGEVLIDSAMSRKGYFSPGVNVLCAIMPDDGYNHEDAVSLSDHVSHSYVSLANNEFEKELKYGTSELTHLSTDNTYQYIPAGGVLAEVNHTRADDDRAPRKEVITTHKESGILYDCRLERDENGKQKLKASLLGFNHLEPGDKMSGRHGNKGTDSRIQDTSLMPMFLNGMPCDVVLNPCGIVSRMNMGQELEGHCGFIAYMLGISIESDPFNGATLNDVKDLMKLVYDLAHMNSIAEVKAKWGKKFPDEIYACAEENYTAIKEWEGAFFADGSAPMWNPATGKMFEYPITFGMPYFLKIVHEVEHKIHSRGGMLEEDYSQIDKQPRQGAAKGGGQKKGEMEMATLMAHGASNVVWESCNTLSDNVEARTNMTMKAMSREPLYDESEVFSPRTVDLWRYYTEVAGAKIESPELSRIDDYAVQRRRVYDPKIIIKQQNRQFHQKQSKHSVEATMSSLDAEDF